MNSNETFEKIGQEMLTKFLENNPDAATGLGLHDPYDYLLPNGSSNRFLKDLRLLEETLARLSKTVKREELSDEHKIDWELVEIAYEQSKFAFYEQRAHELNPDAFTELGGLVFMMLIRNYAPLEKRMDAIAARIEKIPGYLDEFHSRFENSHPAKLWIEIAIETTQNMNGLFQFILQITKGKIPEATYARLRKASENLEPVLKKHMLWLHGLLQDASGEWALGKQKFEKLLQLRRLNMTSDEIYQIGTKYLSELKSERERLAHELAPGKSGDAVLKTIESNSPKTFEEALEFTRKTMEEARRFIQEKNLATTYSEDVVLVEETPAFLAPMLPFAAMAMPARFDRPQIGVYIVTRPKDTANLGKHLNYPSIRNTAVHEAFPGHFLQGAISNRSSIFQLLAQGTETVEGWAHYCEQMMAEHGFAADLETRFVRVNDMIWRAVRIIVDVKLSTGEMSFEEAVEMLVREVQMSREAAEAEVKRYTQTPGYPLSYLLGKHLILKLKENVRTRLGSKFDEKSFHDTITANGYMPTSLLQKVFDQKISKRNTS